ALINTDPARYAHYFVAEAQGLLEPQDLQTWRLLYGPPAPYTRERFQDTYQWMQGYPNLVAPRATYEEVVDNRAWQLVPACGGGHRSGAPGRGIEGLRRPRDHLTGCSRDALWPLPGLSRCGAPAEHHPSPPGVRPAGSVPCPRGDSRVPLPGAIVVLT